MIRYWRNKI